MVLLVAPFSTVLVFVVFSVFVVVDVLFLGQFGMVVFSVFVVMDILSLRLAPLVMFLQLM